MTVRGSGPRPLREALLAFAVTLSVSAVGLAVTYVFAERAQTEAVRSELLQLATTTAAQVDGSLHNTIRSPDQEIEGVDSYTRIFGTYGAARLVLLIRVIDTGLVALVGRHLGLDMWFYVALVVLFGVMVEFIGEVRAELKRVTWPSQAEVYATTVVVILTSLVFGLYLFGIDLLLNTAVQRLFQRFGGA